MAVADRLRGRWPARRTPTHLDAVSFLTVYLVLLFVLESRLVIGPLGGAGNPATLLAGAGFGWWALHHAQRSLPTNAGPQPVRAAMLAMFCAMLASYAAAMVRPISGVESGTAILGVVTVVSWMGVGLLTNDGIPTMYRFEQLVHRIVLLTAAMAFLGLAQFLTNDVLIDKVAIPGLSANTDGSGLGNRSGFTRPFGTTVHPIEFGAVVTMVLPLAIARARVTTTLPLLVRWGPPLLMGLAVVTSISRSAVICGATGLIILAAAWSWRARRALIGVVVTLVVVVSLTLPGMLRSLTALFATSGDDGSVVSRTGSYPLAFEFFGTSPLFGRGYSTFLPSYRIFDNQYLLLLVEVGIVGLLCVVAVLVVGLVCAARARRTAMAPQEREYGQALLAGIGAASLGLAFYDGFSFPTATGLLFVMLGLAGALMRLIRDGEIAFREPSREPQERTRP